MENQEPTLDLSFAHNWTAEILDQWPQILPARRYVYPSRALEIEPEEAGYGALHLTVRPAVGRPFLATCALGYDDPAVPTGLWSCPDPGWLCAVSGGYAYLVDTADPARFTHLAIQPVLEVHALPTYSLLLFAGHHTLTAWGAEGEAWQSPRLSAEGIRLDRIEGGLLHGFGWDMLADAEVPFALDLRTGLRV